MRYHKVLLCYISILFHLSEESGSNRVLMAFIQVRDVLAIHQEIFLYDSTIKRRSPQQYFIKVRHLNLWHFYINLDQSQGIQLLT